MLPFLCIVLRQCPYGLDGLLYLSHFVHLLVAFAHGSHGGQRNLAKYAFASQCKLRLEWFTGLKSVVHTVLICCGFKPAPGFKVTQKAGSACADADLSLKKQTAATDRPSSSELGVAAGGSKPPAAAHGQLTAAQRVHGALSRVSNLRRWLLPLQGTLDLWVIMAITVMDVFAVLWVVSGGTPAPGIAGFMSRDVGAASKVVWLGLVRTAVRC